MKKFFAVGASFFLKPLYILLVVEDLGVGETKKSVRTAKVMTIEHTMQARR